jgi:ribonuclease BN (tRNA processing enzyme)
MVGFEVFATHNHADHVLKLANATAECGLLEQQDFRRSPKATVIGGRYSISKMLQIDGRSSTTKKHIRGLEVMIHHLPPVCLNLVHREVLYGPTLSTRSHST